MTIGLSISNEFNRCFKNSGIAPIEKIYFRKTTGKRSIGQYDNTPHIKEPTKITNWKLREEHRQ
jgi:hypothetical protein